MKDQSVPYAGGQYAIINAALDHYREDPTRWFPSLHAVLMSGSAECKQYLFYRLAYTPRYTPRLLEPDHLFSLIDLCRSESSIVRTCATVLLKYPDCPAKIVQLFFFWLENNVLLSLGSVEHYLRKMANANPRLIKEYLVYYQSWHRTAAGAGVPPILFEVFACAHPMTAIEGLALFNPEDPIDRDTILELSRRILGCCYRDRDQTYPYLPEGQALYRYLSTIGRFPRLFRRESELLTSRITDGKHYRLLIDAIEFMIERMEDVPTPFDAATALRVLTEYPTLERVVKPIVTGIRTRGHDPCYPLFDRLMSASLPEDGADARERRQARAILDILERGAAVFCVKPNGQHPAARDKENQLQVMFKNRFRFKSLIAEMLLYIRLESVITIIDKSYGENGNLDLEIACGDARVIIEIKAPLLNQDARFSNGAHVLSNRAIYAIGEKTYHFASSGAVGECRDVQTVFGLIAIDMTGLILPVEDIEITIESLTPPAHTDNPVTIRHHLEEAFCDIEDVDKINVICDNLQHVSGFIFYYLRPLAEAEEFGIYFAVVPNPIARKHLPNEQKKLLNDLFTEGAAA